MSCVAVEGCRRSLWLLCVCCVVWHSVSFVCCLVVVFGVVGVGVGDNRCLRFVVSDYC